MQRPVRLSIVSYLNSLPFLHGLQQLFDEDELHISVDIPSACAEKLASGAVDIGLIPVAAIPGINNAEIFSDYCIACDGKVGSVLLVSEVPIEEIQSVLLDYQSRTSVQLVKILLKEKWHRQIECLPAVPGYEDQISKSTAGLIIGDRALVLSNRYPYTHDLGEAWKELTGLPFVFAAWVSTATLSGTFIEKFNAALKKGLDERHSLSESSAADRMPGIDLLDYWTDKIRYDLGPQEKEGMKEFLMRLKGN